MLLVPTTSDWLREIPRFPEDKQTQGRKAAAPRSDPTPCCSPSPLPSRPKNVYQKSAVTHYIGDMEPEEATSCSQAGTPVELQEHQPTHETFNLKFTLSRKNAGMEQRLGKWPTNNPPNLRPILLEKHQSLTLLMILCYACRQESSITVL